MGKRKGTGIPAVLILFLLAVPGEPQAFTAEEATTAATAGTVLLADSTSLDPTTCQECHGTDTVGSHHETSYFLQGECTYCHSGITTQGGCSTCHTMGLQNTHHHPGDPPEPIDCSGCHTNTADLGDCLNCHLGKIRASHHAVDPDSIYNFDCNSCHLNLKRTSECSDCHGPGRVRHHRFAEGGTSCQECHPSLQSTENCRGCHQRKAYGPSPVSGAAPLLPIHHEDSTVLPYNFTCFSCHPDSNLPSQVDCVNCHTTIVGTAPVPDMHHMTLTATTNQCGTCHLGASPVVGCTECHAHDPALGFDPTATHHSLDLYASGACVDCHVGAEAQRIVCAACHSSAATLAPQQPPAHHAQPQATDGCGYCHAGIQLNGSSCSSCHTASVTDIHHGQPLEDLGGNCAECHQTANDPAVCANCHEANPHHTTAWSQKGDCTHCHHVPPESADRPKQAACRECHGQYIHDKGGPIQDYGACAACHGTVPFHPAPTSIPGYTGYGAGKKKFNIFWSKYAIEEGPGEDLRPNGEDMDDKGGRKIKTVQLDFHTKSIVYAGKTYSVPHFDPATGTESLADCTRCHSDNSSKVACDNSKWTSHLTNGWVSLNLSQLAEATYLGSLCPGSDQPPASTCDVVATGTYVEAERYTSLGDNWSVQTGSGNGDSHLKALNTNTGSPSGRPVRYQMNFPEAGTWYLWVRGNDQRSGSSNSLWYGLDGRMQGNATTPASDYEWHWVNRRHDTGSNPIAISVSSTGVHSVEFWSREDNFRFDGFYLTKSSGSLPGGDSIGIPTGAVVVDPTTCGDGGDPTEPSFATGNVALGKPITASKYESGYEAAKAIDGNSSSRWWTRDDNDEWIRIDLGDIHRLYKIVIAWHSYYADEYDIYLSQDGSNWSRVAEENYGRGGTVEHTFRDRDARYLRVYCDDARSSYGFSIYAIEAYSR